MYFCPECSYSLDISKISGIEKDERIVLEKPSDAIKIIEKNIFKYKPNFSKNELLKNLKFKKLDDKSKKKLEKLFINKLANAEFKCQNCGYNEYIKETISLYSLNNNENQKIVTTDHNKIIVQDKTLPRTRDYNCKNSECLTHKDSKLKEAVFYRTGNNFEINYICTVCYFGWKL
jgi:hypothetical protein